MNPASEKDIQILSAPSKTFLIGEYVALQHQPVLVLNTTPCFELWYYPNEEKEVAGIHPESPAGLFLGRHLKNGKVVFVDPHDGQGGFGASTAQYALSYQLLKNNEAFSALETYQQDAWSGQGPRPSGADLVAQMSSSQALNYIDFEKREIISSPWPFSDIDFLIFRTGKKLPTHEHLQSLDLEQISPLSVFIDSAWKALQKKDSSNLIQSLNSFYQELKDRDWVADHSLDLMDKISKMHGCLAVKGCGALGADTLLVLCKTLDTKTLKDQIRQLGLDFVSSSQDLLNECKKPSQTSLKSEFLV